MRAFRVKCIPWGKSAHFSRGNSAHWISAFLYILRHTNVTIIASFCFWYLIKYLLVITFGFWWILSFLLILIFGSSSHSSYLFQSLHPVILFCSYCLEIFYIRQLLQYFLLWQLSSRFREALGKLRSLELVLEVVLWHFIYFLEYFMFIFLRIERQILCFKGVRRDHRCP